MASLADPGRKKITKHSATWALAEIGDRWSFIIISVAFIGTRRFEDFLKRTGSARSTLTTRLRRLEACGILKRRPYQQAPLREEYFLTQKGLELYPQVMMSWVWERKWGVPYEAIASELVHKTCGHAFTPRLECGHCHQDVTASTCRILPGPGAGTEDAPQTRIMRRLNNNSTAMPKDGIPSQIADIVGDRWTALTISTQFYGLHKFAEIQNAIGIAANILTDRLKILEANDVLERKPYQSHPPRYDYRLTEKGKDIFPISVTVTHWADRWIAVPGMPPHILHHKTCGHELKPQLICNVCKTTLHPKDVEFKTINALSLLKK
ncbi:winged helix-turn-helix transcriptional regulator [Govanella unica]|uniref:Helix-turn-helix transcriptional regulator n=1 Tax=Govanella unica TaxID=2975056 RepID=A0A9X3TY47_9PROT|nr:helix-turn-helix domain-containing protein [Govania unica]MDA5193840.1 helix-turn-helix transcriptional regulator [Govania unica]